MTELSTVAAGHQRVSVLFVLSARIRDPIIICNIIWYILRYLTKWGVNF